MTMKMLPPISRTSMLCAAAVAFFVSILQWRHVAASTFATTGNRFHSSPKMFCYYSTYAQNRPDAGQFLPEDIDPDLCTHVIIAFGDIIQGTQLKASGWNDLPNGKDAGLYARTLALKKVNPRLKVLLAVGGWRAGSEPFVAVVNSETNRKSFAENAALFIRRHGFDGLDIDWEFPGSRGSGPEHKSLFTLLLKDVRETFEVEAQESGNERLLLTMAAAGGSYYIELAYEPSKIIKYVDYLLVMAYNYHGSWNQFTGHHSGLFSRSDEVGGEREWNQAWTVNYWLNKAGAARDKVIIGISTYGTTFTLASSAQHGLKAASTGPGEAGKYTKEAGTLAYYEICENLREGWTSVWIEEQKVPYAYHDDQWVGYDNLDSVSYKATYLRQQGVGGAFIWSLEMDDFRGSCGTGKYPLLSAIVSALSGNSSPPTDGTANVGSTSFSDTKTSVRLHANQSPSPRSHQAASDQSPSSTFNSRFTTGSSSSRGRFGSSASSATIDDVVHSGSDGSDSNSQLVIRRRTTSGGSSDFDDVSSTSGRRNSDVSAFDDVISSGSRHNQQQPRHRQDSAFAQQEVGGFRERKFGSSASNGDTWDDGSDVVGRGAASSQLSRPSSRRNDDFAGRRNSDLIDSDLASVRGANSDFSVRSRPSGGHASSMADNASSGCSTSGVFVKPRTDCRAYYVCVQHGSSWHQFHMTCPQGTTFRTDLAACSDAITSGAGTSSRRSQNTCLE